MRIVISGVTELPQVPLPGAVLLMGSVLAGSVPLRELRLPARSRVCPRSEALGKRIPERSKGRQDTDANPHIGSLPGLRQGTSPPRPRHLCIDT